MAARLGHTRVKGLRGPQKVRVGFGVENRDLVQVAGWTGPG